MNCGIIGLGKLGRPVAVAMSLVGHKVMGYDTDEQRMTLEPDGSMEAGVKSVSKGGVAPYEEYLSSSALKFGSMQEVVNHSELVFVAVQTPHDPAYEGTQVMPEETTDFDYKYLVDAVDRVAHCAEISGERKIVVIISTCLPGTVRREILPRVSDWLDVVYNPSFIAMGTTMQDFLYPEFVLLGSDSDAAADKVERFYAGVTAAPVKRMTIESAELVKCAYNTFISQKITFANTLMEICDKIDGCDVDAVTDALCSADRRLISPAYMRAGMGDGGGCHPRDNIAMADLAKRLDLSADPFTFVTRAREKQAGYLCELLMEEHMELRRLIYADYDGHIRDSIIILGDSYKKDSNLRTGSPAVLCKNILESKGVPSITYDPLGESHEYYAHEVGQSKKEDALPAVYLIGMNHTGIENFPFPKGSVVVDPWRIVRDRPDIRVIRVGEARTSQKEVQNA